MEDLPSALKQVNALVACAKSGPHGDAALSFVAALAGEVAVEIVENGAAARQALLVVVVGRGDARDHVADAGGFLAAVLAVLQVDVMDDLADRGERRIGRAPADIATSTSKVQRSPRCVNSPSNMSKRSSPG